MENKFVGLSISLCVHQIMEGKKKEEDVIVIYGASAAGTQEQWDRMMELYQKTYWASDPQRGVEICQRMRSEGKIRQPGVRYPWFRKLSVASGIWVDAIKWKSVIPEDLDAWTPALLQGVFSTS